MILDVEINGKQITNSLMLNRIRDIYEGKNLNPSSVSPVLKTPIEIQLDVNFPYTLKKEDFSVNASSFYNSPYLR